MVLLLLLRLFLPASHLDFKVVQDNYPLVKAVVICQANPFQDACQELQPQFLASTDPGCKSTVCGEMRIETSFFFLPKQKAFYAFTVDRNGLSGGSSNIVLRP